MVGRESSSPTETSESGNSPRSRIVGRGIALNRVSIDVQSGTGPIFDPLSKEEKEKEKSEKEEEGPPVAPSENNNNLSGVRKKLLLPAEEALESARAAAELVLKDAMEALQRTKQRLMEVLLPHHAAAQAAPSAEDKTNSESEIAAEGDSEEIPTTEVMRVFSAPTLGIISRL